MFTTREYAEVMGLTPSQGIRHLRPLILSGQLKPITVKIKNLTGGMSIVPAWEVTNAKSE